jgi:DNA-binding SARP family transcriptional activator/ABC-type glycerol-3-phosphate transport system substrate-binding protein
VQFRLLGPLEVLRGDEAVPLGGPKQRIVLAHLLLHANSVVTVERLIDALWGEEPPATARNTLQTHVKNLRRAIGAGRIRRASAGYLLEVGPDEVDLLRFEAWVEEARRRMPGDVAGAANALRKAVALWRGRPLDDLADTSSLRPDMARLEELRMAATEERIDAELALGRHRELVPELETLVGRYPFRERVWGQLMVALYRSGRQGDALAAFSRARELLANELGIDPSPELQGVHQQVLQQDAALEPGGQPLRGYRLLEPIGEGSFGVVHRALQPEVGREVAVKIVRRALANHPEFIRRFDVEAQLVARLEHPHIVPLYDYWRKADGAYIVMRYLRGGSLRLALEHGPVELDRLLRIVDQVSLALAAAHRQGVVHRDVKPANILFDEEGNAYVTDFGIAKDLVAVAADEGAVPSLDWYVSPEEVRGEATTHLADVYGLGIVLFECLTGRHAFASSSPGELLERQRLEPLPSVRSMRPELPPAVDEVVARATAKAPGDRFIDTLVLAEAFREAVAAAAAPEPLGAVERRNPYKGLRSFGEADAADFFGRDAACRELVARLAENVEGARFLAVVGPSGGGKSSLVRAGLVPALRRGAIPGSDHWFVVEMVPGQDPFEEVDAALERIAIDPRPGRVERMEGAEDGLLRIAEEVLPSGDAELLLVIDQFEEVFTVVRDESRRARFLAEVAAATTDPRSRLRVVVTLRADFYDRPLLYRVFGDLLADRTYAVTPLSPAELERAVAGPAETIGVAVEPRLVGEIVAEVADRPGMLPLLQYALTEAFEARRDSALTLDTYRELGGVSGALAQRAEDLYRGLTQLQQDAARQLFLRLVGPTDSTSDDIRRRVPRSELASVEGDREAMGAAIDTFGARRLLSFDRDPETRGPTIEVAHETLLREWARLRGWIESAREDLRLHARLSTAAREWEEADRSPDYLLTGSRLAQAEGAIENSSIRLTEREREYLKAGLARRDAERGVEEERRTREARLERRAFVRLRALVAVLAAAAVVAASLAIIALNRSREAELSAERERIGGLTAASVASLETDPQLSLLLALYAVEAATLRPVPAATVEAFHWAIQEAGVEYPSEGPVAVIAGPLGTRGVFDLPLAHLAELARAHVTRSLTPQECERFLGAASCPPLARSFEHVQAEPIRAVERSIPGQPLAGTEVTVYTPFDETGPYPDDFRNELRAFTAATGIRVRTINASGDFEFWVRDRVAAGDRPELTFFPQPRTVYEFAQQGELVDVGTYLDAEQLTRDQSPFLASLGTVAPDGSWPSADGSLYGVFVDLNLKSLIWYPPPDLRAAGYDVPETWDELIALGDRLVSDGRTPWCVSFDTGAFAGWPGTDWIENLVLAEAGPQVYDRWTFHETPFASPPIREAFERLGRILFSEGYVYRGVEGVPEIVYWDSLDPMLKLDPPGCWLNQSPGFMAKLFPDAIVDSELDAFAFPALADGLDPPVLGGGSMMAAFVDRPEVRELVRFLLSPEFGAEWARRGHGFVAANRRFDLDNYTPFDRYQAEVIQEALAVDTFRFDASDLMPFEIGQGLFWDAMMTYLAEGPGSLDGILAELDDAWPSVA